MNGIFPLSAESTTQSANLRDSTENASNPKLATLPSFAGEVCGSAVVDMLAGLIRPRTRFGVMGGGEFGAAAAAAEKINAFTVTVNTNRPRPKDKAVDPLDMVDFKSSN